MAGEGGEGGQGEDRFPMITFFAEQIVQNGWEGLSMDEIAGQFNAELMDADGKTYLQAAMMRLGLLRPPTE